MSQSFQSFLDHGLIIMTETLPSNHRLLNPGYVHYTQELERVIIQMKAIEQYYSAVLFIAALTRSYCP